MGGHQPPPKVPFKAIREKSEENRLLQKWPFRGQLTLSGKSLSHFWPFLLPLRQFFAIFSKTFSRGLHYYGMILLYCWVRFSHFPPLVDSFLLNHLLFIHLLANCILVRFPNCIVYNCILWVLYTQLLLPK